MAGVFLGAFNVKVFDPVNPDSGAMFDYDVGMDCPKAFSVVFHIPTSGADTYEKRYLVSTCRCFITNAYSASLYTCKFNK